jgi:hypothetical protein
LQREERRGKEERRKGEEQMSFTTWKVRKDNCCEGQAQEERKEKKKGKYESEGRLVHDGRPRLDSDDPTTTTV